MNCRCAVANSTQDFDLAIDKISEKFGMSMERAMHTISLDAFERVVRLTPVGDADYWKGHPKGTPPGNRKKPPGYIGGNARNNWWFSLNKELAANQAQGRKPNKSPNNQAYAQMTAGVLKSKLGDRLVFQNGVPYILKLENGTGSPRQAPNGMVALAFQMLKTHFAQVLGQELKK